MKRVIRLASAIALSTIMPTVARAAMTFNITNGGGATSQMLAGVAAAAAMWADAFDDSITVNIRVKGATLPTGVLGHTDSFYDLYPYADVRSALVADRQSADDLTSTNALQMGSAISMLINRTANDPDGVVSITPYFDTGLGGPGQAGPENNAFIRITSANAKALAIYPGGSGNTDGIITFTTQNIYDFDRSDGIAANKLDFVGIAAHEIGHVLGFDSGVDLLAGNATAPGLNDNQLKYVTTLDLFKFSTRSIGPGGGPGVIDWTADDTDKYFSVDGGATPLALFSHGAIYEESHWQDGLGLGLMDPTAVSGELLAFTSNDFRAFDVIGYNRVGFTIPEPSSGLMLLGLIHCIPVRRPETRRPRASSGT
ncbi:MAG: PEP-CTERM sorting domain-containing protein [Planctomycetes bacterium]|nr:PEP-CTERM sorting domain-containing protein [Planctomycetota bacterium]